MSILLSKILTFLERANTSAQYLDATSSKLGTCGFYYQEIFFCKLTYLHGWYRSSLRPDESFWYLIYALAILRSKTLFQTPKDHCNSVKSNKLIVILYRMAVTKTENRGGYFRQSWSNSVGLYNFLLGSNETDNSDRCLLLTLVCFFFVSDISLNTFAVFLCSFMLHESRIYFANYKNDFSTSKS